MARRPAVCAWCEAPLTPLNERAPGGLRCAACGAITTDPWPTDAELDAAYAGAYRPDAGRFSGPGDAVLARLRALPAKRIDAAAPSGPILDVGAGEGWLAAALAARGRRTVALEPYATVGRAGPGAVEVRAEDVLDHEGRYAAVVFWHALEHLRRPGAALRHAARTLLAPGGVLVVAIPNPASLQARAFTDDWLALDPPRHLVHVPRATLLATLHAAGLTVERTSATKGGQVLFGWLHGLTKRATGEDLYDAIRRPEARQTPVRRGRALAGAAAVAPLAAAGAAVELARGESGTTYVEARA
jgi:SAM-dependent methyltransferase